MRKKSKKLCAIVIVAAVVLLPEMWNGDSKAQGSTSQAEEELYTKDWEKAYVELLSHIDENLYDPYGARAEAGDDPINTVTLFLYDFDADGIPELVVGDDYDTDVYTCRNGKAAKIASLYQGGRCAYGADLFRCVI
jgi:ABC-type cobalt transport system substrate-binding protein